MEKRTPLQQSDYVLYKLHSKFYGPELCHRADRVAFSTSVLSSPQWSSRQLRLTNRLRKSEGPRVFFALFVNSCMLFLSGTSIVLICVLFLHVCVLGPTHPVKNGCIVPGPKSHCASYSGFHFVCWSQAVSVRECVPEELPGVITRLVRGSAS